MELFEEPVKVGSVTRESKNTHTVNSKRLANKRLLLFLRPVALTLFLDEKKNEKKKKHTFKYSCNCNLSYKHTKDKKCPQSTHLTSTCIVTQNI